MKKWIAPVRDTAVFVALYFAAQYLCMLFIGAFSTGEAADASASGERFAMTYIGGSLAALALIFVYVRLMYRGSCRVMHAGGGFDPRVILWGVALLFCISIVIEPLLPHLPAVDQNYGRGGWILLSVVVAAPVAEELLFRGMLFGMLRRHAGAAAALILSSAVFAVMHRQPAVMIDAFAAGMALCYIYLRTRSIYACIVLHVLNNALAMSMQILEYQDKTFGEMIGSSSIYFIVYAVALIVFFAGCYDAARTLRKARGTDKNSSVR